ncbi:MAG: PA domain-containing protein [Acidobacteriota bacterium]
MKRMTSWLALSFLALALMLPAAQPASALDFILNIVDPPGVGFNDPTPAAPVGGNPGVTIGEQRLIAFQVALDIWGATLDSDVDVVVQATFLPLACSPTAATLGAAGTIQIFADFPGAEVPGHWYHSSLANKLAGVDLTPGPPDPGLLVPPFNDDIVAFFNSDIDNNPNCLPNNWYYGLDGNSGDDSDFLSTLTHELGHGLGFSNFISEDTGAGPSGLPDIYTVFSFDNTLQKHWNVMTDAERVFSATNSGNLVWDGASVFAQAPNFLGAAPILEVVSPASIAGTYEGQDAAYGAPLTTAGVTGTVVVVDDGVGTGSDGCEPIANAAEVAGNIALIDRGSCAFTVKVANAEAAGAVAAIVANNVAGGPAPMGGFDAAITIPSIGSTLAAGDAIKAESPGVVATLGLDETLLAGADAAGNTRLYAPAVVALGSSISHWDTVASPNLLMEPFLTETLQVTETLDLTPYQMEDIGWTLLDSDADGVPNIEDLCDPSNADPTVVIGSCDSGVANVQAGDGCNITDLLLTCPDKNTDFFGYLACTFGLTKDLKRSGVISGQDKRKIRFCIIRDILHP